MVGGPFWLKFELLDIMHVLYIRIKMDHIDSNREKMATSIISTLKGS